MPLQFANNSQSGGSLTFSANRAVLSAVGLVEASEAEARARAVLGVYMSPLRVGQAIEEALENDDFVTITDYGGIGDGDIANATVNAAAIQAALLTGKNVWIPYTSAGYHFGTATITLDEGQSIIGENQVLLKSTATTTFISVTAFETTAGPASIDNIKIDMTGAGASSAAVRFATSSGVVSGAQFTRMVFTNCVTAFADEVHATNYVVDITLYDIRCLFTLGMQIYIRRSRGFMQIDSVRIDQTLNTPPVTWSSARFEDFIGLEINRFDSVGPVTTTYQAAVYGLEIIGTGSGVSSVWLNRILVDSSSGNGINISGINFLNGNWIESYGNLGTGITLTTIAFSELTNIFVVGGVGVTGATASANGFACPGCTNLSISNLLSSNNTGSGLSIAGAASGISISNYQSTGNTNFAVALGATANGIIINGGSWSTNGGTLSNGSSGANIVIRNVNGYAERTNVADANATALASDEEIAYTSISTARTVTLPSAALYPAGRKLLLKDVSGSASSTVTISAAPNGTDTINGSNTTQVMIKVAYGFAELESNGSTAWAVRVLGTTVIRDTGTSGTTVPLLDGANTWSALQTFNAGALIASGQTLSWNADLVLRRLAAASLAFGAADAAAPVAQTASVQNVVAGTTDTAGADWTFKGSQGTGTGQGGSIDFQLAIAGATASTQNALASILKLFTQTNGANNKAYARFTGGTGNGAMYVGTDPGLSNYIGMWFTGATTPTAGNYGLIADVTGGDPWLYWNAFNAGGSSYGHRFQVNAVDALLIHPSKAISVNSTTDPGAGSLLLTGILRRAAPVTETNATHTLAATTTHLIANRAGTITVTLPAAASHTGREVYIKTIQAQTVVSNASDVVPSTSATAGTAILPATDGAWAFLVSDGTSWIIMAANPLV